MSPKIQDGGDLRTSKGGALFWLIPKTKHFAEFQNSYFSQCLLTGLIIILIER